MGKSRSTDDHLNDASRNEHFSSRQEANNINLHFASVGSKIIGDNNNASNVDLSSLKSFVEISKPLSAEFTIRPLTENLPMHYTECLKKMVIELWSALARSLYNLQKSFFHSRKDQAFSFRMSPFL